MIPIKRLIDSTDDETEKLNCSSRQQSHASQFFVLSDEFDTNYVDLDWGNFLGSDGLVRGGNTLLDDSQQEQSVEDRTTSRPSDSFGEEHLTFSQDTQPGEQAFRKSDEVRFSLCYGMVHHTKVRLVGDMSHASTQLEASTERVGESHYLLRTAIKDGKVTVCLNDGNDLALLNNHLQDAFANLLHKGLVRLQVLAKIDTLHSAVATISKAHEANVMVDVNIYGSERDKDHVGWMLSAQQVWLQRPDWHSPGTTYENPHILKIKGLENMQTRLATNQFSQQDGVVPDLQRAVSDIFSNLTRGSNLKREIGDSRLATQLLKHQEEALNFMLERENGPVPEQYQMWKAVDINGQTWYRHVVTGQRRRHYSNNTEIGYGILADEMGMGKTFSVLALFVATIEASYRWAQSPETYLKLGISPNRTLSRATLVVVPSALLFNGWNHEIALRVNLALEVMVYHGQGRTLDPKIIANHDIVLTTYQTMISDHQHGRTPLRDIAWYRIILDEAHFIRRQATQSHRSVAELDANFRWCLTGTPIQNSLDDIGSLFSFIRAEPFDRLGCFRQHITAPFKGKNWDKYVEAQEYLRAFIDSVCIRRTKERLDLREPCSVVRRLDLSYAERLQYQTTKGNMKRALANIFGESPSSSRFGIFQAKLQLRILCNHGTFQQRFHWALSRNARNRRDVHVQTSRLGRDDEILCSMCEQYVSSDTYTDCSHVLCLDCRGDDWSGCPLCAASSALSDHVRDEYAQQHHIRDNYFALDGISTKMAAVMRDLRDTPADCKSLVFSCWTTTLDLLEFHLKESDLRCVRIDGNTPSKRRQQTLDEFEKDDDLSILIMTTGVGAFGLNLTAASRVFIIEPQWNPSVENQAIGRVLRIGQDREVLVTRYIMRNTVEEQLELQQRHKLDLARMTNASSLPTEFDMDL